MRGAAANRFAGRGTMHTLRDTVPDRMTGRGTREPAIRNGAGIPNGAAQAHTPPTEVQGHGEASLRSFLMRLGPEIEPCGGYSRSDPKPPGPVMTGAQTHGQGERENSHSVVQGQVASGRRVPPPIFLPCDKFVATVRRKATLAPSLNSFYRPGTVGSTTLGSGLALAESLTKGARS